MPWASQECTWRLNTDADYPPSTTSSVVAASQGITTSDTGAIASGSVPITTTAPQCTTPSPGRPTIAPDATAVAGGAGTATASVISGATSGSWGQTYVSNPSAAQTSVSTGSSTSGTGSIPTSHHDIPGPHRADTAATVAGVIGGLFALSLLGCALWYRRRWRASQAALAPSAVFMRRVRNSPPGSIIPQDSRGPLYERDSQEPLPRFTMGPYSDQIIEKLRGEGHQSQPSESCEGDDSAGTVDGYENASAAAESAMYSHTDLDLVGKAF